MAAEDFDFEILKKGKKIYKPGSDFAIEHSELLRLFSLYISFDPDFNYNKSYLLDKIVDFSYEMNGYYRKHQIIEEATQKWISSIPPEHRKFLNGIVFTFDEVFQFKPPFADLELIKLPSLKEVRSNNIKITCCLEHLEIMDCEKVDLKNGNEKAIDNITNTFTSFLQKVIQNTYSSKGEQDEK